MTNNEPLRRRSLPASLHVLIMRHLSAFCLFHPHTNKILHFPQFTTNIKTFSLAARGYFVFINCDAFSKIHLKKKNPHPPRAAQGCKVSLTPDGERASLLAVVYLVSQPKPMALLRCDVPSWFCPLIIEPEASRAPSLPARTRERQHRPCTQLGRKGNFDAFISAFYTQILGSTTAIKI